MKCGRIEMVLFLRNKNNETILDADFYEKDGYLDINPVVCIEPYSKFLLSRPEEERDGIITRFDDLQELRGWLWESYFGGRQNTSDEYKKVLTALRSHLKDIADKYELIYVED
jgi:hypothetical protein